LLPFERNNISSHLDSLCLTAEIHSYFWRFLNGTFVVTYAVILQRTGWWN